MMLNIVRSLFKVANSRSVASSTSPATLKTIQNGSEIQFNPKFVEPREVWIENLNSDDKQGIMTLNSKVFAATPRMDIIHLNIEWQRKYRFVSFAHAKLRFECRGGGR